MKGSIKLGFKSLLWTIVSVVIGSASIIYDCANVGSTTGFQKSFIQGTVVVVAFAIYGSALIDYLFARKKDVPSWTMNLMILSAVVIPIWCLYVYSKQTGPVFDENFQLVTLGFVAVFATIVKVILFKYSER